MGKSSNELEREISELRSRLSGRTDHVKGRVQGDVEGVKGRFEQQVESVKETANYEDLEQRVRERPLTYTAGALGVGVVLGMLSESITVGGSKSDPREYSRQSERRQSGNGLLGGVLGSITGNVGGTIQDEVQSLIRQAFEGFKQGQSRRPSETTTPPIEKGDGQLAAARRG